LYGDLLPHVLDDCRAQRVAVGELVERLLARGRLRMAASRTSAHPARTTAASAIDVPQIAYRVVIDIGVPP